ncbi:PREDICTED: intermediate filament protein A-like [Priapulus caudatus]|uniref:Intermediate filament protein A-like n=1 Tax=Priapulus caudatus TaxID=37621 RepID=A0ABM1ETJ2_PRICU|nr:PREDICTED: intermediate filament protein A-like [Priapulus caudatus]
MSVVQRGRSWSGGRLRKTQQFITVVEDTVGYMYMPGKGDDFKQQVCKSVVGSVPRPTRRWETALVVRWDGRQHATGSHILRNNQGTVSIAEVDPEGRYILLENASWKRHTHQFMGGWRLERWLTPTQQLSFTFPDLFKLDQGNTCVIWANCPDATPAPPHQLVWQGAPSWGSGANMETRLVSVQGEEKSTYIERRS